MSRDPDVLSTRVQNVDEVRNSSVPDLVTSLRSAIRPVEDFEKVLASVEGKWKLDIEQNEALRKEREVLRASLEDEARKSGVLREENERLRGEMARLESATREAEARQRGRVEMLKGENKRLCAKIDEMRKGEARGREEVGMLKEENVRLRRNQELVREMRRVFESDKDVGALRNEQEMKDVEGKKGVPGEANGFIIKSEDGGDGIDARKGNDSWGGGASSSRKWKARKMLDFGEGTCVSASATTPPAGSSDKSLAKEIVVSQGDGGAPLKEVKVCSIDDDVAGSGHLNGNYLSLQKATVGMHLGWSNQESENSELKRKRDSAAHEKKVVLGTTERGDGSCLHGGAWKNVGQLRSDLKIDYKLCMKAVCALYKRQKLAPVKSLGWGFSCLREQRGNYLAEFLTDRDLQFKLKKSVKDLQDHCSRGLTDCRKIALEHCHQLFVIYQQKEDPYF